MSVPDELNEVKLLIRQKPVQRVICPAGNRRPGNGVREMASGKGRPGKGVRETASGKRRSGNGVRETASGYQRPGNLSGLNDVRQVLQSKRMARLDKRDSIQVGNRE